jgi:hypothetical protein
VARFFGIEQIERVIWVWYLDARCDRTGEVAFRLTLELTNQNRLYLLKEVRQRDPKRQQLGPAGPDAPRDAVGFARSLGFGPMVRVGTDRKKYLKKHPEAIHYVLVLTKEEERRLLIR